MFLLLGKCVDRLPSYAKWAIRLQTTPHSLLRAENSAAAFGARDYRRPNKFKTISMASNAASVHALLTKIPDAAMDLSTDAIMNSLKSMETVMVQRSQLQRYKLLEHQEFIDFCQRIEHSANQFTADEAVDILCIMHTLGVPVDAKIGQRLLRVIQVNIADLQVDRTLHLADLLKMSQSHKTILSTAIQCVLPTVLLKKLPYEHTDHDLAENVQILEFIATGNAMQHQQRQILFEYVLKAMLSHETKMSANRAMNMLYTLLRIPSVLFDSVKEPELFDKVVLNFTDALAQDLHALKLDRLLMCSELYAGLCARRRQVFNANFFRTLADYVIEVNPNFDVLIGFLYYMHKAGFRSMRLLDHFIKMMEENPRLLSTEKHYEFTKMVECFLMGASLPTNWSTLFWPAIEQNPLYQKLDSSINWLSINRKLIAMGFYDPHLISATLNSSYLDNTFGGNVKDIKYIEFLEISQNCALNANNYGIPLPDIDSELITKAISIYLKNQNCPFQSRFEQVIGVDKMISSVRTDLGHFIQHIMKFDCITGTFATTGDIRRSEEDGFVRLEDISKTENEQLVAVQVVDETRFFAESPELRGVFKLLQRTLLDLKLIPVIMNIKMWANRNDLEIRDYIFSEINQRLQNENKTLNDK